MRYLFACLTAVLLVPTAAARPRDMEVVELTGRARDYRHFRPYRFYYLSEDMTFLLEEESTGKTWRIISREPTPNYEWRMGPTYTGLKVDWAAKPKVKLIGVRGVDRSPATFHDLKLDEPNLATAFIVFVETAPGTWKEYYVNNWFHKWGDKADPAIYRHYADKGDLYRVFGFANAQAAPFDAKSKAIFEKHKALATTFQGKIKTAKDQPFGYELELIDLVGKDVKTGGRMLLYGDGRTIPKLESKKPEK